MLYLSELRKRELATGLRPTTQGDLAYMLTLALVGAPTEASLGEALQAVIDAYMDRRQESFRLYCDVIGALTCALLEYERRVSYDDVCATGADFAGRYYASTVATFLDSKLEQNGDVYPNA